MPPTPTSDHQVTSWGDVTPESTVTAEKFKFDVLKMGGLVTFGMPFNVQGATVDRDIILKDTAKIMLDAGTFNPKYLRTIEASSARNANSHSLLVAQCAYFQNEKCRGGHPNPKYSIAPGWTTMYHSGEFLIAKPYDVATALTEVLKTMPSYDGLDITIIDGQNSEKVTLDELNTYPIVMMAPPITTRTNAKRRLDADELDRAVAAKHAAEAALAKTEAELRALKESVGACQSNAIPAWLS